MFILPWVAGFLLLSMYLLSSKSHIPNLRGTLKIEQCNRECPFATLARFALEAELGVFPLKYFLVFLFSIERR